MSFNKRQTLIREISSTNIFIFSEEECLLRKEELFSSYSRVVPALPDDDRVLLEITHIDRRALADDVRVLADQEPAHVREEEAPLCVVRIRVCVRKLMVNSVVPHPLINVIL